MLILLKVSRIAAWSEPAALDHEVSEAGMTTEEENSVFFLTSLKCNRPGTALMWKQTARRAAAPDISASDLGCDHTWWRRAHVAFHRALIITTPQMFVRWR